jgi:hypothetical protein
MNFCQQKKEYEEDVEEEEDEDMNGEEYEAQEMEDQFEAAGASFSGTSEVRRFRISRGN